MPEIGVYKRNYPFRHHGKPDTSNNNGSAGVFADRFNQGSEIG
jgi:hypothetical protein